MSSSLPDYRLRRRLQRYAAEQFRAPSASTNAVCKSESEREGAYRFLENKRVEAMDIIEGPIAETVRRCAGRGRILAIQDTTSVEVKHQELREALSEAGSPTGWHSHVALAVEASSRTPLGILAQDNWIRDAQVERRRRAQKPGPREKESARWHRTAEQIRERFAGSDVEVMTVADREADIYELLAWHAQVGQPYVIRAKHARKVRASDPLVTA